MIYFDPITSVFDLIDGLKVTFMTIFFSVDFISVVWINKLHDSLKRFFPANVIMEIGKRYFSVIRATFAKTKNASAKI